MRKYIVLDNNVVVASLETHGEINDASYIEFDLIETSIDFSDVIGCLLTNGEFRLPESPLEPTLAEVERAWRDSEIKVCAELKQEIDHPYLPEINAYLQLLRDYPSEADFPNGTRPSRPLTPSGVDIIL
ncbi:hypothetical protein F0249_03465 [Vibrio sp. 03-59-1]|uniref:phage tail assembly chaperone n=1 Tax=Vibrio sp. 03-59-1 TaxID=2607607 RepID=UPI0014937692|nr:phage tail assembly chaperone [Vibrio sp. 03-59-1]NOH82857.1 hypothetical protein [Vibrio sp. 03-59-1]